jgi:hypothetical protein
MRAPHRIRCDLRMDSVEPMRRANAPRLHFANAADRIDGCVRGRSAYPARLDPARLTLSRAIA